MDCNSAYLLFFVVTRRHSGWLVGVVLK